MDAHMTQIFNIIVLHLPPSFRLPPRLLQAPLLSLQLFYRTNGGNGCDYLAQFQFVEDGGLPSCVQPHHKNSHLFLAKERLKKTLKRSHGWSPSLPYALLNRRRIFPSLVPRTYEQRFLSGTPVRCKTRPVKTTAVILATSHVPTEPVLWHPNRGYWVIEKRFWSLIKNSPNHVPIGYYF